MYVPVWLNVNENDDPGATAPELKINTPPVVVLTEVIDCVVDDDIVQIKVSPALRYTIIPLKLSPHITLSPCGPVRVGVVAIVVVVVCTGKGSLTSILTDSPG